MKTKDAAKGKWFGVLKGLGVPEQFLKNQHGPCPLCGGNDRFRFDDRNGEGTYYCNACGAGDGIRLAVMFLQCDFAEVCKRIDAIVGNVPVTETRRIADPMIRIAQVLRKSHDLTQGGPVRRYLESRKVPSSKALMEIDELQYFDQGQLVGTFPAMVAKVTGPTGDLLTLHVTYLTADGKKAPVKSPKKMLPAVKKQEGGSIRLARVCDKMGIAEGIETALACMKLYRVPTWAACNAGMMEQFRPPQGVSEVVIFADKDESFRGEAAGYTLAHRLFVSGITPTVEVPREFGDYADMVKSSE